jgi:dTMP kinase
MVPECELLLYYASRAQHVQEKILTELKRGSVVLCDRFVDATVAYQSYGRGIEMSVLNTLNNFVLKKFSPTLTLIFDLPVETGLHRARQRALALTQNEREDRLENEVIEFHQKVRAGYLKIAAAEPERVRVIDASGDVATIHNNVKKIVGEIVVRAG